jgi:hypothetical protein
MRLELNSVSAIYQAASEPDISTHKSRTFVRAQTESDLDYQYGQFLILRYTSIKWPILGSQGTVWKVQR